MKQIILSILFVSMLFVATSQERTSSPPRLVVNIVVGAMRAGDIDRYRTNFRRDGFVRLADGGLNYKNASYNFHQTITTTTLATLTTGAMPSTHGVIGNRWWDYASGEEVDLVTSKSVRDLDYNIRNWGYSSKLLIAPTLTEALLENSPESKCVSIAIEPTSAVVMNGCGGGSPFWLDSMTCEWGSSTAFMESIPSYVKTHNKSPEMDVTLRQQWVSLQPKGLYVNKLATHLKSNSVSRKYKAAEPKKASGHLEQRRLRYEQLAYTPLGNKEIFNFAQILVDKMNMGSDATPDILNIYLDPMRNIAQRYGSQSVEVEDAMLNLDKEISNLITFLTSRISIEDIVITLSSDHGCSPVYGAEGEPKGRFNTQQFAMLVGGFLRAQYGSGNWVLGYEGRNLYLNHTLITKSRLSIADIQNEVAVFALQFRGVAQAMTASALRGGYFGSGYGEKIQNSFYPSRSGDVVLNFMPGWIEDYPNRRSDSGSTYRYDNYVPLIIYGEGQLTRGQITREVLMTDLAPSLAYMLDIESPAVAEGTVLNEILEE